MRLFESHPGAFTTGKAMVRLKACENHLILKKLFKKIENHLGIWVSKMVESGQPIHFNYDLKTFF